MPFLESNIAQGIQRGNPFRAGRSNTDDDQLVEQGKHIPWSSHLAGSYMYYDCTLGVMLDSGMVVHNTLPQYDSQIDTLATIAIDDPRLDTYIGLGVNMRCQDQYRDVVQRMGHSRYWFRLWGQAIRLSYQVPIPGIRSIGGELAIPYDKNPQWAHNSIVPGGNYSGVILWRAQWSLWFTTLGPVVAPSPNDNQSVAKMFADPSAHINGNTTLPRGMQAPHSQADDNARSGTSELRTQ